ncbi:MAG: hypothetical protein KDA65_04180 [Planctomycetaceae bacterium]|nr:hypothetical protein [Planctomycetaceae bacterium]
MSFQISNSTEFNRQIGQTAQGSQKLALKWLGIGIKAFFEFMVQAVRSIIGR